MKGTVENKGVITLGAKVMVSDPCYGLGTWCQGVLENVLPGQYDCNVEYSDEGTWGTRVSAIEVTHVNYKTGSLLLQMEDFEVGVDSGQAGIFDYEYYAKYHMDATERPHVNDDWYDMVCDKTDDCDIDMAKEPIRVLCDGEFITADGTTLGGDDGIAIAYILAILASNDIPTSNLH